VTTVPPATCLDKRLAGLAAELALAAHSVEVRP
jgi:hypothetical protein